MSSYSPDRQRKSPSTDKNEAMLRKESAEELVHELIGDHQEEFSDPAVRLDFIGSLDGKELYDIAQHINRRMRGMDSHEMRAYERDKGAFLPALHTPSIEDKLPAFMRGSDAIQEYIKDSDDSQEQKIQGVSLALEALIIQVHPFDDGNGRTGRFLGEFTENGSADIDKLINAATSSSGRTRYFGRTAHLTRENAISTAHNTEIMLDDDEREALIVRADSLPTDVEGIYLNIKRILEDDDWRQRAMGKAA